MELRIFGLKQAWYLMRSGDILRGIYRFACPLEYIRDVELGIALRFLQPHLKGKLLDIGSPKILANYLSWKYKDDLVIYATDIMDKALVESKSINAFLRLKNLIVEIQDTRSLSYPDNFFDCIFSISALEHIAPDDTGDIFALKEIRRVLKREGILVITLPYHFEYTKEYKRGDVYERKERRYSLNFFQRFYDEDSLITRIISDKFKIIEKVYIGERVKTNTPGSSMAKCISAGRLRNFIFGPIHKLTSDLILSADTDINRVGKPIVCCLKLRNI